MDKTSFFNANRIRYLSTITKFDACSAKGSWYIDQKTSVQDNVSPLNNDSEILWFKFTIDCFTQIITGNFCNNKSTSFIVLRHILHVKYQQYKINNILVHGTMKDKFIYIYTNTHTHK